MQENYVIIQYIHLWLMNYKIKGIVHGPENKILQQSLLTLLDSKSKSEDNKKERCGDGIIWNRSIWDGGRIAVGYGE